MLSYKTKVVCTLWFCRASLTSLYTIVGLNLVKQVLKKSLHSVRRLGKCCQSAETDPVVTFRS